MNEDKKIFQTSEFTFNKPRKKPIEFSSAPFQDSESEFEEMCELLIKSYTFNSSFGNWLVSRLENWKFGGNIMAAKTDPDFFRNMAQVWRNKKQEIIGFCVQEGEGSGVYMQPRPGDLFIIPHMVNWIVNVWGKNQDQIETYAVDEDYYLYELLTVAGFKDMGESEYLYEFETTIPRKQKPLVEGFQVKTFTEYQNDESLVKAVNSAFGKRASLNTAWLQSKLSSPSLSNDWQLSIVNSDGDCAGFCFVWIDSINKIAEIDPVGTHVDYQRKGLAKHLMIECFCRLKAEGIETCYITSAPEPNPSNRLYQSLSPESIKKYHRWKIQ